MDIHLEKVQEAATNRQAIDLQYFSPGSGEFTERTIEPIGVVQHGNTWHVIAYCRLRQGYRNFRLDRMSKLSLHPETYAPHDQPLLMQYLEEQSQTTDATLIKVQFAASAAPLVRQQRCRFGFVQELIRKEAVEMWFLVVQEEAFCQWLLMHGEVFTIVSPVRLHEVVRSLLK